MLTYTFYILNSKWVHVQQTIKATTWNEFLDKLHLLLDRGNYWDLVMISNEDDSIVWRK